MPWRKQVIETGDRTDNSFKEFFCEELREIGVVTIGRCGIRGFSKMEEATACLNTQEKDPVKRGNINDRIEERVVQVT